MTGPGAPERVSQAVGVEDAAMLLSARSTLFR